MPRIRKKPLRTPSKALRLLVTQPLWLPVLLSTLLVSAAMAAIVFFLYTGLKRFDPLYRHVQELSRLEEVAAELDVSGLPRNKAVALSRTLNAMALSPLWMNPRTPGLIRQAARALDQPGSKPSTRSLRKTLDRAIQAENAADLRRFEEARIAGMRAMQLSLTTLLVFPFIIIAFLNALRSRLITPLERLAELLVSLSEKNYYPLSTEELTPVLRPLFNSYNQLVNLLRELESEHENRQQLLESTVTETTRTLTLTQAALARTERLAAVGELAAGMAHDLRNPLAGIRLALHNLQSDCKDAALYDRLQLIGAEVDRLVATINTQLSRVRQQPEPPSWVDVSAQLKAIARLQQLRFQGECRIRMDPLTPIHCRLPEVGFRLAVENLVTNACEAVSENAGEVHIQAGRIAEELRIIIEDNGPGFPADLLEQGPRPFISDKPGGTGLGLASALRFAHENQGRLQLSNCPGGGARVVLVLPCAAPRQTRQS